MGLRVVRASPRSDAVGTEEGLRAAYSAHGGELYGFARRALDDDGRAEEAVQETFLRAWRAADRFDPHIASLRAWLFSICRNVIIDATRARACRPLSGAASADAAVDDDIDGVLRAWQVEEALRRISADHRFAITETYYRGRVAADLAAELGVPAATVRTRLFYGLKALRLALEEMGWDDE
jgi:RNA polymerase sigma-70 factor (ECF subfamily)